MDPNDLLRLASLLRLQGETMRLFSDAKTGGDGKVSRISALAMQIDAISAELADLSRQLGANDSADDAD